MHQRIVACVVVPSKEARATPNMALKSPSSKPTPKPRSPPSSPKGEGSGGKKGKRR